MKAKNGLGGKVWRGRYAALAAVFSLFAAGFGGGVKSAAAADPVNDALFWYGNFGSDAIRVEASNSVDPARTFNFMGYNISQGIHSNDLYAFQTFNGYGFKVRTSKDYCALSDHNVGYVDEATGQVTKLLQDGSPNGSQSLVFLPNKNIHFVCISGGHYYDWDTYSQGYPVVVAAIRSPNSYSRAYKAIQFYCEAQQPNFQQYGNRVPPGYASDYLDYRDHGYILELIATQCNDALDNDQDGLIDSNDPGCRTTPLNPGTYDPGLDNESVDNANRPAGATNFQASDGTSLDFVRLTWTAAPRATQYQLYRSQFQGDLGSPLTGPVTGTSYNDTSAVPGVTYYYTIVPQNSFGNGPSSTDSGFRGQPSGDADCDGDGATDAEEIEDGTGVCDPGSFQLHLKSPAYTKYNTYLSQTNFLELIADGTMNISGTVAAYDINGNFLKSQSVTLAKGQEFDVDIQALINNRIDTYGIVKIDWNYGPGATLLGRTTHYRLNPGGANYSFAFAQELRNATRGDTYATGNSYDPQGIGYLVPNWGEIVNVSDTAQTFQANLYSQAGQLLYTRTVTVPRFGESDIQAGHEYGQSVYLFEVKPFDGNAKYLMTVSRYSSNSFSGSEAPTYNYAFSLEGRQGTGSSLYAPTENRVGGCYSQTNWTEIVNTREKSVTANVTFRSSAGAIIGTSSLPLAPKSQYHLNASALLPKGSDGSVKVESNEPGSLLTQSLVYFHDCASNALQTGFAAQGRIAGRDIMSGTMNSFLGMKNELFVASATNSSVSVTLSIAPFGTAALPNQTLNVGTNAQALNVLNASGSGFPDNSYGVVKLDTNRRPMVIAPFILRYKEQSDGRMDFIFPTMIQ